MNKFTIAYEGLEPKHLEVLNERFAGMDVEWIELDRVSSTSVSTIDVLIVKDLEAPSDILCGASRLRLVVQLDPGKADIDQDTLARGGIAYDPAFDARSGEKVRGFGRTHPQQPVSDDNSSEDDHTNQLWV